MLLFKVDLFYPEVDLFYPETENPLSRHPRLNTSDVISVSNALESITLGIIRGSGIRPLHRSSEFDARLAALTSERGRGLSDELDHVRRSARDMLRNGSYKPTGRGKPASEYLLRAAVNQTAFPRINWPVDVCNYISLKSMLPVSLWDLSRTGGTSFVFRLGRVDERYVFNSAGQEISLSDLVVGCDVGGEVDGVPIVNPVKDCLRTKTSEHTSRVAACVYAPGDYDVGSLHALCRLFAEMLGESGAPDADVGHVIVKPGQNASC